MKKIVSLMLALALCFSLSITAFAAVDEYGVCNEEHVFLLGAGECNADGVNIRTGPGTNYASIGMAYKGEVFNHYQCERESRDWIHVHGDHIGWIYYEYYTDVEPARIGEEVDTNSYIYEVA